MADFGFESTAEDVTAGLDLTGTTWLVTGCNSGLGLETARVLGLRGGRVVGLARTEAKAALALASVGADGVAVACDLSDLDSVRAAVERVRGLEPLDGIIANAGVMAVPELRQVRGLELQFATNHVGHFALVNPLVDRLTDRGRVVLLSSGAHRMAPEAGIELDNLSGERDYHPWKMYGQSKLANLLHARSLARRLDRGRTANSVHPGVIQTNLGRHQPGLYERMKGVPMKTIPQGAATQVRVATDPALGAISGEYFADCQVAPILHDRAIDDALAEALWEATEALIA